MVIHGESGNKTTRLSAIKYVSPLPSGMVLRYNLLQGAHHPRSIARLRQTNQPIDHRVQLFRTAGGRAIVTVPPIHRHKDLFVAGPAVPLAVDE